MQKILVIEDEPQIRANTQEVLELGNFLVITAENGQAGLKLAEEEQPDLILCDIMMPELDGYGVLKALRHQPATAQIPIIFLTARSDQADIRRGMNLGADDYLPKPFEPTELLRAVNVRLKRQATLAQYFSHSAQSPANTAEKPTEYDSITHLPNWLSLQKRFEYWRHQIHDSPLTLVLLKINPFSAIRHDLGHTFSNSLLKEIAERLRSHWNSADTCIDLTVHLGTDQFALLFQGVASPLSPLVQEIDRLLEKLTQPFHINNHKVSIFVDMGLAIYPDQGVDLDSLITHAEKCFEPTPHQPGPSPLHLKAANRSKDHRLSLETSLRQALEKEEFAIYYQPQIDLKTGRITGAEALLRWAQPHTGFIPTSQFLTFAEETNLMIPIGEWVLYAVCNQIKEWHATKREPVTVAVNISAQQFRQANFSHKIHHILQTTQIDPLFLDLELTESLMMQDIDLTISTLQTLKRLGVNIAIDDFGAGYSSLRHLQLLPFDTLKIDQQFVRNIDKNPGNRVIVRAIIQMAHNLHINTVAEGVETARELAFFKEHNCRAMQGYLFSHPLRPTEFEQLLTSKANFSANIA
ncbi:MAG: EAL domain-containing protein [Leptolyngbyaceae cyanobacterium MO_188.B28]|nr:EAL domain-containing protein [Leptolyngbyaceae cyanobacterium MO_188.B28]